MKHPKSAWLPLFPSLLVLLLCAGCASTRIAIKEKFGYAKREQLVDRVQEARDGQIEAKEQISSALDQFLAMNDAQPSELETLHAKLDHEYGRSVVKAEQVGKRIKAVEQVARALFKEWKAELREYSSDTMRKASAAQLQHTQDQYERLIGMMKSAQATMTPVLATFKDHVLFLKHNLNARAIASLQGNVTELRAEVTEMIAEMEVSIAEADAFIEQMQGG